MVRRAVFLDRDGTLNQEVQYLHRVEEFSWIPGAPAAISRLNQAGFLALVVTNQAGVARGYYSEEDVQRLHAHMQAELNETGARIDRFYYCPYHPKGISSAYRRHSLDRKPGGGMFMRAIQEWGIAPALSYVVGDRNTDLDPGRRLGMTTLLVETGYGEVERATPRADHVVQDVTRAVDLILRQRSSR